MMNLLKRALGESLPSIAGVSGLVFGYRLSDSVWIASLVAAILVFFVALIREATKH